MGLLDFRTREQVHVGAHQLARAAMRSSGLIRLSNWLEPSRCVVGGLATTVGGPAGVLCCSCSPPTNRFRSDGARANRGGPFASTAASSGSSRITESPNPCSIFGARAGPLGLAITAGVMLRAAKQAWAARALAAESDLSLEICNDVDRVTSVVEQARWRDGSAAAGDGWEICKTMVE
jgi:hypothetical protein